jgi:PPP family 3-phenylpropionic acid transporter
MKNSADKFWSFTFYLLFFAGAVAAANFYALYFEQQGIPGSQIGLLMGLASLVGFFSGPVWSGLADTSRQYRLVLSLVILGNATAVFFIPFFRTFVGFLVLMLLQAFFRGPILPIVDSATVAMLGDEKEKYGRIRLGGTLGWGLAAPVVGIIAENFGLRWNFTFYSVALLMALIVVQRLRFQSVPAGVPLLGGVKELLRSREWIVFLLIVFIGGSGNAAITNYLLVYLQKIGTSPTWMGWALTISTLAEAPALFFANKLMKRLDPRGLLTLGLAAMSLRCGLYGLITVPWAALTVQLLQFFTFPILLVAGVSYADRNAPAGLGATAQSLFSSAFMGFGFAAGGFLGGVLIQYLGVQQMFLSFAAVLLPIALVFGLANHLHTSRQLA